ncbi:unnamed protein product [Peniophora sp. CBMAI 1063]|nr:unnamed protein product [Peniophora sp. CBMAI 1063]
MPTKLSVRDMHGLGFALKEAQNSYDEGGIPIGSALLSSKGELLGKGHNMRVQRESPTLHAEIAALENAGRLSADVYRDATIYTTLSPCDMCTGAILLYRIPRVVIGENSTFMGGEELLRARGVEVIVAEDKACQDLMEKFVKERPAIWFEDIGEVEGSSVAS